MVKGEAKTVSNPSSESQTYKKYKYSPYKYVTNSSQSTISIKEDSKQCDCALSIDLHTNVSMKVPNPLAAIAIRSYPGSLTESIRSQKTFAIQNNNSNNNNNYSNNI